MSEREPTLVMFHGGIGAGPAEKAVGAVRVEEAHRAIPLALKAGFGRVVIATDSPTQFDSGTAAVTIEADPPQGMFSFADRLISILRRNRIGRPVVMGAGALPLLTELDFEAIAAALQGAAPLCVTNNFYSADLTGWHPAELLERIETPARDNLLPRLFREGTGIEVNVLPRTTATQFDLDTPTDVAILATLRRSAGPFAALEERARDLMTLLCERSAEIVVAGRIGSSTWRYLEGQTACRGRVLSEERGLATAPRGHRARSFLGFLLEDRGPAGFFEALQSLGDGVFLDTRVLLQHLGLQTTREERFQSDLFAPQSISDPRLREFSEAAADAPRLLLGGHSLVSGGLMALNDAAWGTRERNARIGGHGVC